MMFGKEIIDSRGNSIIEIDELLKDWFKVEWSSLKNFQKTNEPQNIEMEIKVNLLKKTLNDNNTILQK